MFDEFFESDGHEISEYADLFNMTEPIDEEELQLIIKREVLAHRSLNTLRHTRIFNALTKILVQNKADLQSYMQNGSFGEDADLRVPVWFESIRGILDHIRLNLL